MTETVYVCVCVHVFAPPSVGGQTEYRLQHQWHADWLQWCELLCVTILAWRLTSSPAYCFFDILFDIIDLLSNWLKLNERSYQLLSLTCKVLTTSKPSYRNNLISVQLPRITRSSSVVTLSCQPTVSSLKITDRSSDMHYPISGINSLIHSASLASRVSTYLLIHLSAHLCHHHHSHHPSLFHSRLKTYFFNKSFPPEYSFDPGLPSWSWDLTGLIMLLNLF